MISPGAVDMGGLIITPREEDFRRVTPELITDIYREISLTSDQLQEIRRQLQENKPQPQVKVGIISGQKIHFALNAPYTVKGDTLTGE